MEEKTGFTIKCNKCESDSIEFGAETEEYSHATGIVFARCVNCGNSEDLN